ncbi:MAG: DUF1345 domain-containing protein [Rhizomicrobium sp.]
MPVFARSHLTHHWRFYACFLFGAAVYLFLGSVPPPVRVLAGGDAFFASYIAMLAFLALSITPKQLDRKADVEDEGIVIVILFALVMIGFCLFAIITLLHLKQAVDPYAIALAIAGAPLGWFMLHMMMAFHYAYLFYSEPGKKPGSGLSFPGTEEPGAAEFLYYAFVIGMTFQVSDVQVTSTRLRRMTLSHSIVSFFFNTCLIAMAVNAVVAIAT